MPTKYDAFISYSHSADGRLAPAIQTGLQMLARPWNRRRALWVFRDETGLTVSPALWPAIRAAMDSSTYFILLASPDAARSPWVDQEVAHWRATKSDDRILLVLTDGTWSWDDEHSDRAEATVPVVPQALAGAFEEEPRHLDLRWARDEDQLDLRHSRFRAAIADLAAPIHGKSKEDLEGADIRQFRRFRRIRAAAVAALATLTLVSALLGVIAMSNADRAEQEAETARREARVALSRQLSADAKNLISTDLDLALLLGVEAYRREPTTQAYDALLTLAVSQPELGTYLRGHQDPVISQEFVADERLVSVDSAGLVMAWDVTTGQGEQVVDLGVPVSDAAISEDGASLAFTESFKQRALRIVDLPSGIERHVDRTPAPITTLDFTKGGRALYGGEGGGRIFAWNTTTGEREELPPVFTSLRSLAVAPRGDRIAVADDLGRVVWWDLDSGRLRQVGALPAPVRGLTFSTDGSELAFSDTIGNVRIWSSSRGSAEIVRRGDRSLLSETSGYLSATSVVEFSPDGAAVAATSGADTTVWRNGTSQEQGQILPGQDGSVLSLAYSPDGQRLAVGTNQGLVAIWAPDGATATSRTLLSGSMYVEDVAATASGDRLAAAGCAAAGLTDLGDQGLDCTQGRVVVWQRDADGAYQQLPLPDVHTNFVETLSWSGDERLLASGSQDGRVELWDVDEGTHEQIDTSHDTSAIAADGATGVAVQDDGGAIGIGRFDEQVTVWDVDRGRDHVLRPPKEGEVGDIPDPVTAVAFVADDLVSGRHSGVVEVWDIAAGARRSLPIGERTSVSNLVVDPVTNALYVADDESGLVETWDVAETTLVHTLEAPDFSGVIAVRGDGNVLAIGTTDGVDLLESTGGRRLGRRLGEGTSIRAVDFGGASTSTVLIVGTEDQVVLWKLGTEDLLEQACRVANRQLTAAEWSSYVDNGAVRDVCAK